MAYHMYSTIYFSSSTHCCQSCHCLRFEIYWLYGLCVLLTVPQSLIFSLLIASSSSVLLGRESLISILDWRQPLQVFHLFRCCCLKRLLMNYLPWGCQRFGQKGLHNSFLGLFIPRNLLNLC
jgi:hypothetical protein